MDSLYKGTAMWNSDVYMMLAKWTDEWTAINKHIEAETKWPPFSRLHFQMHFLEKEIYEFHLR